MTRDEVAVLQDLIHRMVRAQSVLDLMSARETDRVRMARLSGKAEGIGLAISYVEELVREAGR